MKYSYTLLILLLLTFNMQAQNMVPNGDFENYTSCPSSFSQMTNAVGWRAYHGGSSDYFNVCGGSNVGIPVNFLGKQTAASGNAYGGCLTMANGNNYKEYMARSITPLVPGLNYKVSISVSLGEISHWGTDDLGVWFYDVGPTTAAGSNVLTVTPQVSYTSYGPITDTSNWVRLTATFVADSAYDNIVIGGFTPSSTLTKVVVAPTGTYAYYYVDSVVVELNYGITIAADTMFCLGDTIKVPYGHYNPSLLTTSNVFSLQLSSLTGSFASPTTLATAAGTAAGMFKYVVPSTFTPGSGYRLRVVSSSIADSSNEVTNVSIGVVPVSKPVISSNTPVCTGNTLSLAATTTTTGVSYKWTGPNNFTSAVQSPSITSATTTASGNYMVTARLHGCVAKDTETVVVVGVPGSVSNTSNTNFCEPDTLRLYGTITGTPNSYSWTGPNSFTSSAKDTFIANAHANTSGNYILTANYNGCVARDTLTAVVKPLPANINTLANTPVCTGDTLYLQGNTTSPGTGRQWTGPNSFTSSLSNLFIPNISLAASGDYYITYSLNGCSAKDTVSVIVNQAPLPVTASANTPVCERSTVNLSATTSTTGAVYTWTGPNSFTATTQNTAILNTTIAATGDYVITASLANGCVKKDTVSVVIKPLPANFNATTNAPICAGNVLNIGAATTSTGVSFSWTGPNSFTSSFQAPSFTNAQAGLSGDYIVTGTLNGCTIKDTVTVVVTAIPAKPTAGVNNPVCAGQSINLTATTISGVGYIWVGPGAYSSTLQNPVLPNAGTGLAGKYWVKTTVNGCTSTNDTIQVNVIAAPFVGIYPSPKDTICAGATILMIATPTGAGTGPQYQWYRNNVPITGATTTSLSTNAVNDKDVFYCTMLSTAVCANPYTDTSNAITMTVMPWLVPAVSIAATPNTPVKGGEMISFTATPVNGGKTPQYQWKRNSKDVIGALSNLWGANNLSDRDTICAVLISSYMCPSPATAKSNCIAVNINTTGIAGTAAEANLNIYPNPVGNELVIEGLEPKTTIQLYDVLGRQVYNGTNTTTITKINTAHLVPGTYMLQLTSNDNRTAVKVVKE